MRTALTRFTRVLADSLGLSRRNAAAATKAVPPSAHRFSRIHHAVNAVFEPLEQRALMSTYYISPTGSDSHSGTSTSSAWKSIGKVDSTHFNPGDSVLFQGGQTFYGSLRFTGDGGSSTNRVTIGSYGSGKATINSGTSTGAWSLNSTGITFNNLKFVGTRGDTGSQDGIRIENYSANTVRSGFTVENCDISGYAEGGITFGSDAASEGLNNVTITNNQIYNIVMAGIQSYAVSSKSNTNVTISYNNIHNIYGDGKSTVTGSGIMLQGLNGATVEENNVHDNGLVGGNGEVGIWAYSSNAVLFQYNEVSNTRGTKGDDGDAFDFDADTSNSIMQYNYAANNDGSGFMLGQWWNDNNSTNDIVRYNISQNNGRRNNYSGIDVWGKILNAQIYNNTVYTSPAISGQTSAIRISNNETGGLEPSNIRIANNIFVSTGGTPLVDFYSGALAKAGYVAFTGNVYYSYSGTPKFIWGSTGYTSLSGFRSGTGQEKLNGSAVGAYEDPKLTSPGYAGVQTGVFSLSQITAYNLLSYTPIINVGVSLTTAFGLATPLTGTVNGKTVPGEDQHLLNVVPESSTGSGTSVTPGKVGNSYLSGWDIGSPNKGTNSNSGSTYSVTGGGKGIGGTADSFRYAFTTLTGNGQIVAQISSMSDPSGSGAVGLMVRSSTAANSADVSLMLTNSNKAYMISRSYTGASATMTASTSSSYKWIKLVRNGNTFSTYLSSTGSSWTLVGSTTISMGSTIDIGLAVTSQNLSTTETGVFRNVSVSGTVTA